MALAGIVPPLYMDLDVLQAVAIGGCVTTRSGATRPQKVKAALTDFQSERLEILLYAIHQSAEKAKSIEEFHALLPDYEKIVDQVLS
ncbi:hypothetical protein [Noviherbaspirillum album]|nr:hypothetical protein [Noviherbaspirillum sp. CPCC 100848]